MESLKKEKLEFREIPAPYKDDSEERVYGLFKEDGTKIGESRFTSSRFKDAWYLRDICTLPEFERQGYGSKLLELTCSKMWSIEKKDIVLSVPGNTIAEDGFDRYQWYKNHGFTGPRDFMTRKPCAFLNLNYLCDLFT
ncbi:MAG: GNAT family N-acetyltransferase [Pleurocapsa sp. MO_192.B19]|nr:GNAT family N-acetyltransferase [Pleurocapsa sp. MO_192.B19]